MCRNSFECHLVRERMSRKEQGFVKVFIPTIVQATCAEISRHMPRRRVVFVPKRME